MSHMQSIELQIARKRIAELEACVRALFLIVMDGGDEWTMKGKANDVFKRADLPKPTPTN